MQRGAAVSARWVRRSGRSPRVRSVDATPSRSLREMRGGTARRSQAGGGWSTWTGVSSVKSGFVAASKVARGGGEVRPDATGAGVPRSTGGRARSSAARGPAVRRVSLGAVPAGDSPRSRDRLEHPYQSPASSRNDLDLVGEHGHEEQATAVPSQRLRRPRLLDRSDVETATAIRDLHDDRATDAADGDVEGGLLAARPGGVVAGFLGHEDEFLGHLGRDALPLQEPAKVVPKLLEGLDAMKLPVDDRSVLLPGDPSYPNMVRERGPET